jgi:hypothetical protein
LFSSNQDSADFANNLTAKEADIYFGGVTASREINNWKKQQTSVIKKSSLLGRRAHSETNPDKQNYANKRKSNN